NNEWFAVLPSRQSPKQQPSDNSDRRLRFDRGERQHDARDEEPIDANGHYGRRNERENDQPGLSHSKRIRERITAQEQHTGYNCNEDRLRTAEAAQPKPDRGDTPRDADAKKQNLRRRKRDNDGRRQKKHDIERVSKTRLVSRVVRIFRVERASPN